MYTHTRLFEIDVLFARKRARDPIEKKIETTVGGPLGGEATAATRAREAGMLDHVLLRAMRDVEDRVHGPAAGARVGFDEGGGAPLPGGWAAAGWAGEEMDDGWVGHMDPWDMLHDGWEKRENVGDGCSDGGSSHEMDVGHDDAEGVSCD